MREIKFRYILRHKASGNIEVKHYYWGQIEKRPLEKLSPAFLADYELLSRDVFTGLKDRHSMEIYKSDVVDYKKIQYTDCSRSTVEKVKDTIRGEIYYAEGIWLGIRRLDGTGLIFSPGSPRREEIEVVGNIYENPELLEVT
ncbi:hypothetical protein G4V62_13970 [Bacillaceae bacterium SIJ1]|uniref:YopX family protein n=1 Tax=Litoribacterium kuwaitense TaxID=1398745 RepID=UPI0013ED82DA|nr:YopX family protein [Litoribacterium kuwaitense]NGP46001.1 hypothetical protein [Litoribacterium kuwaitense]